MNKPHSGEPRDRDSPDQGCVCTVSTVEHYLCGFTGFLFTGAIIALLYPALVTLTEPLSVLSSTVLVGIMTAAWLLIWFGLEFAWEWRAGRGWLRRTATGNR